MLEKTLLLTYRDVESLFDPKLIIEAVEEAFREKGLGETVMPPKTYVYLTEYNGDFRVMPSYMKKLGAAGVKIVNVHPNNRRKGMPTVMGVIELIDVETGFPLAIMDGTLITAWRTGAAGAVAAKYLARKDSGTMGVIGTGVQGRMQATFTAKTIDSIVEIIAWDVRGDALEKYKAEMEEKLELKVTIARTPREVAEKSDILATCTPARKPIVKGDWIRRGIHINAMGADAPGKRELDTNALRKMDKIVIDDYEQASHSGEINVPLSNKELKPDEIYGEIGEIIAGIKRGRETAEENTLFDSTGLAIQDLSVAWLIYKKAKDRGLGTEIELTKTQ